MIEPTPREIAFRLLASYHGGSTNVRDVLDQIDTSGDVLVNIVAELLMVGGVAIGRLAEELELSHDETLRSFELGLDSFGPGSESA